MASDLKLKLYRDFIYRKSLRFGESLTPKKVADIIKKADRGGKFKYFFHNGFINTRERYLFFVSVYEDCGFSMMDSEKEFTIENYQFYF